MKVYGLVASGPLKEFSGNHNIFSRKLYTDKDKALLNKKSFIEFCLESKSKTSSLYDLQRVDRLNVVEYEVIE